MGNNPHKDHRKRLKKRFEEHGLDSFEPHNILELLLFFSIPRRDTNDIAHELINSFGSISGVFDADVAELMQIKGVGENSAVLIKLISSCARVYYEDKSRLYDKYDNSQKLIDYFIPKFIGIDKEILLVAYLDNANKLVLCEKISEGSSDQLHLPVENIVKIALRHNAKNIVLAHNHPTGIATPSSADQIATLELKKVLKPLKITLIDHIIVGKHSDALSMKANGYLDEYTEAGWKSF